MSENVLISLTFKELLEISMNNINNLTKNEQRHGASIPRKVNTKKFTAA